VLVLLEELLVEPGGTVLGESVLLALGEVEPGVRALGEVAGGEEEVEVVASSGPEVVGAVASG
jgi:hypothetical protein